jgi:hypothetical protein
MKDTYVERWLPNTEMNTFIKLAVDMSLYLNILKEPFIA